MSSHREVAHAWAHQTGRNRKGHNLYYEGSTIYSYGSHFPVARFVDAPSGRRVVLFNSRSYSISTSKHQSIVRGAIPPDLPVYSIPMKGVQMYDLDHPANHDRMVKQAAESVTKAGRARTYGDMHLNAARRWLDQANHYAVDFQLDRAPVTLESLGVAVADLEQRIAAAQAVEAERQRWRMAERAEQERDLRAAWLAGSSGYWYGTDENGCALLRLREGSADGRYLQTSQGASVPLADAIRAFRFVKLCRERGEGWQRNGARVPVGDFQLDRIAPDGTLRAGCHLIAWAEIERMARQLGVFDEPASDAALCSLAA